MKTHIVFLGLGAALLCGCPPAAEVKNTAPAFHAASLPADPASLIRVADEQEELGAPRNAATALERALEQNDYAKSKASYDAVWRLARAYAELSEPEGEQRNSTVPPGLNAAKRAVEIDTNRVEGHYYLAQLIGFSALLQKGETKQLIGQMVAECETAIRLDEKFDHGGPLRTLGALFARAPKEPVSVGDPEKAVQFLKRAVASDDSFPLNHIYLAEAYIVDERYQEADAALTKARQLLADSRWAQKRETWKEQHSRVERKLRAKQS